MSFSYFDAHLHLPSPDQDGLAALVGHLASQPGLVGGNLILNRPEEVEFAKRCDGGLPETVAVTVRFDAVAPGSQSFFGRPFGGWVKVHPRLMGMGEGDLAATVEAVAALGPLLRGVVVDCFPWADLHVPGLREVHADISLPLVLELARRLPRVQVVAAHGGGYLSWAYRAHIASLPNVSVDFSASLHYYAGSDLLAPIGHYLRHSPERFLIGSDWPFSDCAPQMEELTRVASQAGFGEGDLEKIAFDNASRLWPEEVAAREPKQAPDEDGRK